MSVRLLFLGKVQSSACHPRREIWPEADLAFRVTRKNTTTECQHQEKRGAFKGPIRIPLHSLLFLFNVLALPSISSKSLKFRSALFRSPLSLPTSRLRKHPPTTVHFPGCLPFSFPRIRRKRVRGNVGNCDALPINRTLGIGRFGTNVLNESPGVTSCLNGTRRRRDV